MFCALVKFLQYFKNLKQGDCLPPPSDINGRPKKLHGLMFLKCCKNVIGARNMPIQLIIWRAKLLKCDWLMRRAFFLNSGQKLLDPDWLRRFILSIRTKYQKYTQ